MALQLAPEEPEAAPWRVELLSTVVNGGTTRGPDRSSSGRPAVLAIDGRSDNGKTTVAARISELVPGSVIIHTDDIAWEHSRFGWADLLMDGILVPVHQGQGVSYRPPRWDEHGREGWIEVPADCPLLIIEGDGAGRREVAHLIDTLIWVQADQREAGRRAAARAANPPTADLANKALDGAPFDEDGWMAEERPFNTAQRTWERADIIVCGTPEIPYDPADEIRLGCTVAEFDRLDLAEETELVEGSSDAGSAAAPKPRSVTAVGAMSSSYVMPKPARSIVQGSSSHHLTIWSSPSNCKAAGRRFAIGSRRPVTRRPIPRNSGHLRGGGAILKGVPDNAAIYHNSKVARYRRWVRRLTLKQYVLFTGVVTFAIATAVMAVTSAIWTDWPFSWFGVAVFTVLLTAFFIWWRRDELRQGKEYPANQDDQ